MEPPEPLDLRPADWALIVEGLVAWAGNPSELEVAREERACELAEMIADAQGITPGDLLGILNTGWDED